MDRGAKPTIYFDGVCGLCNGAVDVLLRIDSRHTFRFAPLQGETAAVELSIADIQPMGSIVLVDEAGVWRESAAVGRILWRLGGAWNVLGWMLWLVPAAVRDAAYRLIARSRYSVFGVRDTCRVPTPAERERFRP